MEKFSERLEYAMNRKGLKAAELSKMTGIGEGAISQYRKGAYKATQINLEKLAKALCVSIPWLMGLDDETPTAADERLAKMHDIFAMLSEEQQERELVYLQSLLNAKDR